jgi:FlaG/FlaF family flagellin (archaellin)
MTKAKIVTKITEKKAPRDEAVSPVIGEMLLIALVLLLIPSVTIALMHQLPQNRIPTVNILMDIDGSDVLLYHKGGDYISIDDIDIFVQDKKLENSWKDNYHKVLFDLGDSIRIEKAKNRITLVAKKAVIFRGEVP